MPADALFKGFGVEGPLNTSVVAAPERRTSPERCSVRAPFSPALHRKGPGDRAWGPPLPLAPHSVRGTRHSPAQGPPLDTFLRSVTRPLPMRSPVLTLPLWRQRRTRGHPFLLQCRIILRFVSEFTCGFRDVPCSCRCWHSRWHCQPGGGARRCTPVVLRGCLPAPPPPSSKGSANGGSSEDKFITVG